MDYLTWCVNEFDWFPCPQPLVDASHRLLGAGVYAATDAESSGGVTPSWCPTASRQQVTQRTLTDPCTTDRAQGQHHVGHLERKRNNLSAPKVITHTRACLLVVG